MFSAPILIPLTTKSFFNDNQLPLVRTKLAEIKKRYGVQIAQASSITGVGEDLITAVIFIESGGRADVISGSGAVGLMQVSPGAADSGIYLMNKKRLLSDAAKAYLKRLIGNKVDCITSWKYFNEKKACNKNTGQSISTNELYNPELNIVAGTLFLAAIMSEEIENDVVRLDRAITRYNRGYFSKIKGNPTTDTILATTNPETRAYIIKLTGRNSVMDLLTA